MISQDFVIPLIKRQLFRFLVVILIQTGSMSDTLFTYYSLHN
jgi:hypothetical protein